LGASAAGGTSLEEIENLENLDQVKPEFYGMKKI
jgi:hypothetical protein